MVVAEVHLAVIIRTSRDVPAIILALVTLGNVSGCPPISTGPGECPELISLLSIGQD